MKIEITEEERERCLKFAEALIIGKNQYNRLNANDKQQIQRTCCGKIAEYAFLKYRRLSNPNYAEGDMFTIFEGEKNVDQYDFLDDKGNKIDIKTAFLPNHKNLMIPVDQLQNMPKDLYVGIKLNGKCEDELRDKHSVKIDTITEAEIIGEISYEEIMKLPTKNWGSDCKAVSLDSLKPLK